MNILPRCLFIILLINSLLQTSLANNQTLNPHDICSPSACGIISNISFPFRLTHDHKQCGIPDYELACENNVTFLYLNSLKYQVKAIDYHNFTIRLVDDSVNNNTCSFPNVSLYPDNFGYDYRYNMISRRSHYDEGFVDELVWPINFMSCPHPLNNSSFFTDTNSCDASNSSNRRHTYIKAGHMNASEVGDMCRIEVIVMTSWKFQDLKNVSVSEIHESLLYGFQLSWYNYPCSKCKVKSYCSVGEDYTATCEDGLTDIFLLLIVVMIVVVFVGVSIPAQTILGFTCFFGLSFLFGRSWSFNLRACKNYYRI